MEIEHNYVHVTALRDATLPLSLIGAGDKKPCVWRVMSANGFCVAEYTFDQRRGVETERAALVLLELLQLRKRRECGP